MPGPVVPGRKSITLAVALFHFLRHCLGEVCHSDPVLVAVRPLTRVRGRTPPPDLLPAHRTLHPGLLDPYHRHVQPAAGVDAGRGRAAPASPRRGRPTPLPTLRPQHPPPKCNASQSAPNWDGHKMGLFRPLALLHYCRVSLF